MFLCRACKGSNALHLKYPETLLNQSVFPAAWSSVLVVNSTTTKAWKLSSYEGPRYTFSNCSKLGAQLNAGPDEYRFFPGRIQGRDMAKKDGLRIG